MSLSIYLEATRPDVVFERNITNNLGDMASRAIIGYQGHFISLYQIMWRPDEIDLTHAWQLVELLDEALDVLLSDPEYFKGFNPANCWGDYEGLCALVRAYLQSCCENPDATISVCR